VSHLIREPSSDLSTQVQGGGKVCDTPVTGKGARLAENEGCFSRGNWEGRHGTREKAMGYVDLIATNTLVASGKEK